jgi:hypothetical protein
LASLGLLFNKTLRSGDIEGPMAKKRIHFGLQPDDKDALTGSRVENPAR